MKRTRFLVGEIVLSLFLATSGSLFAQSQTPVQSDKDQAKAERLILQLGSEDFKEREAAEAELKQMGPLAEAALSRAAASSPDQEVKKRADQLLTRLKNLAYQDRLEKFRSDRSGKLGYDLPGWSAFRAMICGETLASDGKIRFARPELKEVAHDFFFEMVTTLPEVFPLLEAIGGPPGDLQKLLAERLANLNSNVPNPNLLAPIKPMPVGGSLPLRIEEGLLCLFLDAQLKPRPAMNEEMLYFLGSVLGGTKFPGLLKQKDNRGLAARALFDTWLDLLKNPDELNMMIDRTKVWNDEPGLSKLAVRMIGLPHDKVRNKWIALMTILKNKKVELIPVLETLFNEKEPINAYFESDPTGKTVGMMVGVQTRDMALASVLILCGQDPVKFGLEPLPGNTEKNPLYGYKDFDEKRTAGFAKWAEFKKTMEFKKIRASADPKIEAPAK